MTLRRRGECLALFAGLCVFVSLAWERLLAGPPTPRVLPVALVAAAAAGALLWLARRGPGARTALAGGAVLGVALLLAAAACGVPARMLAPWGWGAMARELGSGLGPLGDARFPYSGEEPWARLAVLLGLAAGLLAAAAVAFWPGRTLSGARRAASLAVLAGLYAFPATLTPPPAPLITGTVLFLLAALWLWMPRRTGLGTPVALGAIASAALLAVPVSAGVASREPVLDYSSWDWGGGSAGESEFFTWNHAYGPIAWPRTGRGMLTVGARRGHYWRAVVLDRFDGFRWLTSSEGGPPPLDRPRPLPTADRRWVVGTRVRLLGLSSQYVVAPGAVLSTSGLGTAVATDAGMLLTEGDGIGPGDSYGVISYAPDPSPARMRSAGFATDPRLAPYTTIGLPQSDTGAVPRGAVSHGSYDAVVQALVGTLGVPLRRGPGPSARDGISRLLEASPYAPIYRLSRRLTDRAPTAYDAARSVQRYLRSHYVYSEDPPARRYPLRAFLFRDRVGYCQQFSGAMALILRLAGIPARVASGFSPGTPGPGGFSVTDLDAHSWVEVYFAGIGWVGFDPTPSSAPAASTSAAPALSLSLPRGRHLPAIGSGGPGRRVSRSAGETAAGGGRPPWVPLLGLGALAAAAAGALVAARRRRLGGEPLAAAQLAELRSGLARMGAPVEGAATLMSLQRRSEQIGRLELAAYARKLRDFRYAGAPAPPGRGDRRRLRAELAGRGGLRATLDAYLAIPPLGPRPVPGPPC
ncbi:MAG: transglutaminaseTgpA domain-containing protein [Solirubrobacterales bacterium]